MRATGSSCRHSKASSPARPYIPKARSHNPQGRDPLALHQSHAPEPRRGSSKRRVEILFVLGKPPSEGLALDSLKKVSGGMGNCVVFDQGSQGYEVGHTKSHESKNCQKEQRCDSAWQIALSCKYKREQAEQDNNASDRLAKKRDDQSG